MAGIGTNLLLAKQLLENNELVAIPTETVYGLAGNALSEEAVVRIFQVKDRPAFDPLIVHTHSLDKIRDFVSYLPDKAIQLATRFMPGALTLLLPKKSLIPDLVTSGLDTVAIRIPAHPLTLQLLESLDFPLAAPSANPFGYISPTTALHVENQLGNKIKYILDGGEAQVGIESTIVGFEEDAVWVYRLGGTSVEALEAVVGKVQVMPHSSSNPKAPGMLKSHYAPRKKLFLVHDKAQAQALIERYGSQNTGYLAFQGAHPGLPEGQQRVLSPAGNFAEAARNLFAYLRLLDALPVQVLVAERLPMQDLGRAINDRLSRAAG